MNQALTFLSRGGPDGLPPFVLLDGVSLDPVSAAPEPATIVSLTIGMITLGGVGLRRRARLKAVAV